MGKNGPFGEQISSVVRKKNLDLYAVGWTPQAWTGNGFVISGREKGKAKKFPFSGK